MTTLETLQSTVDTLQAQMRENQLHIGILYVQQRLLRASTTTPPNSPTCGPTAKTSAISTDLGRAGIWRRTAKFLPRVLGWAAERILPYLWAYILPLLVTAWGLLYGFGARAWQFLLGFWHWLLP